MKKLQLDKNGIYEYQQNREPYLMIDFATEIIPGKSAKGYKDLSKDEWFFKVHWPNDPNMPGMLQIEALVQMSALSILTLPDNKGKIMYLTTKILPELSNASRELARHMTKPGKEHWKAMERLVGYLKFKGKELIFTY